MNIEVAHWHARSATSFSITRASNPAGSSAMIAVAAYGRLSVMNVHHLRHERRAAKTRVYIHATAAATAKMNRFGSYVIIFSLGLAIVIATPAAICPHKSIVIPFVGSSGVDNVTYGRVRAIAMRATASRIISVETIRAVCPRAII